MRFENAQGCPLPPNVKLIVFFDGLCNLCNRAVDVSVRLDRRRLLRYAPLQGETAKNMLPPHLRGDSPPSLVACSAERWWTESDAVLQVARALGGAWRLLVLARLLPKQLRDALYRALARRRYRIFGRRSTCRIPNAAERELFLD